MTLCLCVKTEAIRHTSHRLPPLHFSSHQHLSPYTLLLCTSLWIDCPISKLYTDFTSLTYPSTCSWQLSLLSPAPAVCSPLDQDKRAGTPTTFKKGIQPWPRVHLYLLPQSVLPFPAWTPRKCCLCWTSPFPLLPFFGLTPIRLRGHRSVGIIYCKCCKWLPCYQTQGSVNQKNLTWLSSITAQISLLGRLGAIVF